MQFTLVLAAMALMFQNGAESSIIKGKIEKIPISRELDNNLEPIEKPTQHKYRKNFVLISEKPPSKQTHIPGNPIELNCEAMGFPSPSIQWLKNDLPIIGHHIDSNEILDNGVDDLARVLSTLIISIPSASDEDRYTCLAVADQKTAKASTTVYTIHTGTELTERYRLYPMSPRIVFHYRFYMSDMGNHVVLPCKTRAHPHATIYWRDAAGETVTRKNPRMKVLKSGELLISNLRWTDMGEYTCIAKNSFGKDMTTTFIYPAKAG